MEDNRVRFGAREWIGLAALMLTAVGMASGLQIYVMDLKLSGHTSRQDIHEDRIVKGLQYMSHSEFQIWAKSHEKTPHAGVLEWEKDAEARLRLLESYHRAERQGGGR